MKKLLLLLILVPFFVFAQDDDKNDDHNTIPPGPVTQSQILDGLIIYKLRYVDYVPKADAIQAIHDFSTPAEIKVVFGDWCSDSRKYIPAFIKTMEFSENKKLQVSFVNVDRPLKEPADVLAQLNVNKVPTFIVFKDGKEIGRIIETPKATVEEDLAAILSGQAH
jgi:thiol-disulfide isomerase/thioredoxin